MFVYRFNNLNVFAICVIFLQNFSLTSALYAPSNRPTSCTSLQESKGFGSPAKSSFPYAGKLRPGKLSSPRTVPAHIARPDYAMAIDGRPKFSKAFKKPWEIDPVSPSELELMRIAGRYAREVLDIAIYEIKPGITTDDIDKIVHEANIARNCYPSPLNYNKFPKSCCTSINEVICHGIPDSTVLQDGDIVNIDITVFYQGVHGDCSETVLVGDGVSDKLKDLVYTTYLAWQKAIEFCKPGRKYSDIGGIIEDIVTAKGYSTVKEFCGHGVNTVFHTNPSVLHYKNNVRAGIMEPGHTFTIEPMICLGSSKPLTWPDKWTATTSDGLPSAQFEHTLLITDDGVDILTKKLPTSPKFFWE